MTTTVRPRTPAELAVIVPYQLGYHPGPSLVLTALTGRRLGMLQRHDLLADPEDCAGAARQAVEIMVREGAGALIVIAFEEDEGSSAPLREAVVATAEDLGLPVSEHLVVREGRWFAPDCGQSCCPADGLPLPRPEDVPAVAAFVGAGVAPFPSRAALVASVLPDRDEGRAARLRRHLEVLVSCAVGRRRVVACDQRLVDVWRVLLDPTPAAPAVADLGDAVLARAAWSLEDVAWRDALMTVLGPGMLPTSAPTPEVELAVSAAAACPWVGGDLEVGPGAPGDAGGEVLAVRARLVELSRLLPVEMTPPVLTLVAHLAWWAGDGSVAAIALERARGVDPEYRLAELMDRLLSVGVRPSALSDDRSDGEGASPGEAA